MRMSKICFACSLAALVVIWQQPSTARGGAIEIPMQSARAAGQADAFTAQSDDPSAIYYNPAGLTQLDGTQFAAGAWFLQPQFHFRGDNGDNERMNIPTVVPHIYAESDFSLANWRFGLGVNGVDGINEDYGDHGPLRTLVDKAQLSVVAISPTIAYQVDEHLSVGLAFNIYYGYLNLERNVVLAAPPVPQGHFRLKGNDFAFGVTPGVMYRIDDRNQIGAYYRSPFTLDFNGKARLTSSILPEIGPSKAHESLNLPQSVGAGYATKPFERTTIEADVIWTDWHMTDQLRIHSSDPHFNNQTLPANWKSGFTLRLGGEYQFAPHWFARAGYAYGQGSVPQATYSPIVPDATYHLISAGIGYATTHWNVDLAYEFIDRGNRKVEGSVDSPTIDGHFSNQMHGLMVTLTYKL